MRNNESIPFISPKVPVQFKLILSEGDLNKFIKFPEIRSHFWKFNDLLDKGSQLYLAFVADNLAGYYLVTDLTKHKPYLFNYHPIFSVDPSYFIFYCRTFERYRNNAIYAYALTHICRNLASHGESVFISADADNIFSQKGIKKAESEFELENFNDLENSTLVHHVNQALRSHGIMKKDIDPNTKHTFANNEYIL